VSACRPPVCPAANSTNRRIWACEPLFPSSASRRAIFRGEHEIEAAADLVAGTPFWWWVRLEQCDSTSRGDQSRA